MNLVSVIVPCYNMSAYLEETLRSIVASDYRPLEVIVIDDGSTDGSAEKAEAFFSNLQTLNLQTLNCHLLRTANGGVSAARNNGLQQAQGYSLIPLSVYFKDGKVKVELALAKGKKLYDKRHDIAERDADREMDRRMKDYKVR